MPATIYLQNWIAGMVASYLRGGSTRKSTLATIDGAKRRLESCRLTPQEIRAAISAGRDRSPRHDSPEAEIITKRYLAF